MEMKSGSDQVNELISLTEAGKRTEMDVLGRPFRHQISPFENCQAEPMPRSNRHYLPGTIWYITHRCHQKEFLLQFARDRQACVGWLFEAKKR